MEKRGLIGRAEEIRTLRRELDRKRPSVVVVLGRRQPWQVPPSRGGDAEPADGLLPSGQGRRVNEPDRMRDKPRPEPTRSLLRSAMT